MVRRHELAKGIVGYEMGLGAKPRMVAWCYRIGGTLIDAGTPSVMRAFLPVLLADGPVTHVYVTHHHEDHSGGAAQIRARTGAEVAVSQFCDPLTRRGFRQYPYQLLYWGRFAPYAADEVVTLPALGQTTWETPDGTFQLLHAPGHSHDMSVVWDEARGALFSADLYLASRLKIMRRDEVWSALEASLKRVLGETTFEHLLCAHRPVVTGGQQALQRKYNWMLATRSQLEKEAGARSRRGLEQSLGKTNRMFELLSLGNVSRRNLVASLLGEARPRPDVARAVGDAWARCEFS